MKKLSLIIVAVFMTLCLVACMGGNDSTTNPSGTSQSSSSSAPQKDVEIYYLNFKPEVADIYDEIARDYQKETGIKLKVVTAASDTYEQTLTSEIAKSNPPTIFQINGPIGYESWRNYCADLKDTKLYSALTEKELAISEGDGVYGIPYAIEGYGIIYNEDILKKYFSLSDKKTDFDDVEDIDSFENLKALVEDMQKNKEALGIDGVFASTSFSSGNDWRWNTHLLNIPFHYEMDEAAADGENSAAAGLKAENFDFKYADNFKAIFDLYLDNSVTDRKKIASKSVSDSMAEFALGKCAMVQNGTWAYSEISSLQGSKVTEENIGMMPIYTPDSEDIGLCVGTENYLAINKNASQEQQKASADFLYWLFSSETGKKYVTESLGFVTPFDTLGEAKYSDPLARQLLETINDEDTDIIPWAFTVFPGAAFKDDVGSSLLEYAQGTGTWDNFVATVKDSFAKNKKK